MRVFALYYRVEYLDKTQIVSARAPEATYHISDFTCVVNHETLTAHPVGSYPDEDSARAALDPQLRAWEATSELLDGYPIRFKFECSQQEVVDPLPGSTQAMAGVAMVAIATLEATATVERGTFPAPRDDIDHVGDLTTLLRARWRNVIQDRELVTSGAYFVYTTLKKALGGDAKITDKLAVGKNVLETLSKLASTEDPDLGRKAGGNPGSLTNEHIDWIKAACRELVERTMLYEAGVPISERLTMAQLPTF